MLKIIFRYLIGRSSFIFRLLRLRFMLMIIKMAVDRAESLRKSKDQPISINLPLRFQTPL